MMGSLWSRSCFYRMAVSWGWLYCCQTDRLLGMSCSGGWNRSGRQGRWGNHWVRSYWCCLQFYLAQEVSASREKQFCQSTYHMKWHVCEIIKSFYSCGFHKNRTMNFLVLRFVCAEGLKYEGRTNNSQQKLLRMSIIKINMINLC